MDETRKTTELKCITGIKKNADTKKIEEAAVSAVEDYLRPAKFADTCFQRLDRFPLWDGSINLYREEKHEKATFDFRIPVQIRGRSFTPDGGTASLRLALSDLRHYFCDGGICYFLVQVNERYETRIYYNLLTPGKLRAYLHSAGGRGCGEGSRRKSILVPFTAIEKDCEEFTERLREFRQECEEDKTRYPLELEIHTIYEEMREQADTYVETGTFRRIREFWDKNHVVIITGDPGAGKTAAAYQLAWQYAKGDTEKIVYTNSLNIIFSQYSEGGEKVFLLDDFWGSIRHKGGANHSKLQMILKGIMESENQRLIITTRDYILESEMNGNRLCKPFLERLRVGCYEEDYTPGEKVEILFSHIKNSGLPWDYANAVYEILPELLEDTEFNPRIVAMAVHQDDWKMMSPEMYAHELKDQLEYPEEFWRSILNDLDEDSLVLAVLLYSFEGAANLEDLQYAYEIYEKKERAIREVKDFFGCLGTLEHSIAISFAPVDEEHPVIWFKNPGIEDCVGSFIQHHKGVYYSIILDSIFTFNQIVYLSREYLSDLSVDQRERTAAKCMEAYGQYELVWAWMDEIYYDENHPEFESELYHFQIIQKIYGEIRQPELFRFLQEKMCGFCGRLENHREIPFEDLERFPQVVAESIKNGFEYDGEKIIEGYFKYLDQILLYESAEKFKDIFPGTYEKIWDREKEQLIEKIPKRIPGSLEYFMKREDYEIQADILIDRIPVILKHYNLEYTRKLQDEVRRISDRSDIPVEVPASGDAYGDRGRKNGHWKIEEREEFEKAAYDVKKWLRIEQQRLLTKAEINDYISKSSIQEDIRLSLKEVTEKEEPWYIYESLREAEFLPVAARAFENCPVLIKDISFYFVMLFSEFTEESERGLARESIELLAQEFMVRQTPLLREEEMKNFLRELQGGEEIIKWVEGSDFFIKENGWVYPKGVLVCLFLLVGEYVRWTEEEKKECYVKLFDNSFMEMRVWDKGETAIVHSDDLYGLNFRNKRWESCMLRLFLEMDREDFGRNYLRDIFERLVQTVENVKSDEEMDEFWKKLHARVRTGADGKAERIFYFLESDWLIAEQLGTVYLYDCLRGKASESEQEPCEEYVTHEMVDMEAFSEMKKKLLEMRDSCV